MVITSTMKRFIFVLLAAAALFQSSTVSASGNRAEKILKELHNPHSKYVLVVSHRGDWRNWPENSIRAIESVIDMNVDIVEIDLQLTKDSVLVLCHDPRIDRTTNGRGRVCDITYDSIQRCVLKTGHGIKTVYKMPTLREALAVCKGRIVVNIDKGYDYYDLVMAITEELGVTHQVLIKSKKSARRVSEKFAEREYNLIYMPVIDLHKESGQRLLSEYATLSTVPPAFELCWTTYTPQVGEAMQRVGDCGARLWVNSLWDSLCGGLSDDAAFTTSSNKVYGRLLDMGASIIQTDRPQLLIEYLQSKGRHK